MRYASHPSLWNSPWYFHRLWPLFRKKFSAFHPIIFTLLMLGWVLSGRSEGGGSGRAPHQRWRCWWRPSRPGAGLFRNACVVGTTPPLGGRGLQPRPSKVTKPKKNRKNTKKKSTKSDCTCFEVPCCEKKIKKTSFSRFRELVGSKIWHLLVKIYKRSWNFGLGWGNWSKLQNFSVKTVSLTLGGGGTKRQRHWKADKNRLETCLCCPPPTIHRVSRSPVQR